MLISGVAFVLVVMLALSGIRITDRGDLPFGKSGFAIGGKVITLGSIAEAAGSVDYTFDGTDDDVQFQAALDALPATGGRLVVVSATTINFGATVTRAIPNVTIEGSGLGTYFVNNGGTALFTAGGNNWKFQDLRTDAGGIDLGATTGWTWTNVEIGAVAWNYRDAYNFAQASGATAISSLSAGTLAVSGSATVTDNVDAGTLTVAGLATFSGITNFTGTTNFAGTTMLASRNMASATEPITAKVFSSAYSGISDPGGLVWYCGGTDDQVQINAAISSLTPNGGMLILSDGNFDIDGVIDIDLDNITIKGQGIEATFLEAASTYTNNAMIENNHTDIIRANFKLEGMTISGDKISGTQQYGVDLSYLQISTLRDIAIEQTGGHGLYIEKHTIYHASTGTRIAENFELDHVLVDDINDDQTSFYLRTNYVTADHCEARHGNGDGSYGFYVWGDQNQIANCTYDGGSTAWEGYGYYLRAGYSNSFIGNMAYGFGVAGFLVYGSCIDASFIGNHVFDGKGTAFCVYPYNNTAITGLVMVGNGVYRIESDGTYQHGLGVMGKTSGSCSMCAIVGNYFETASTATLTGIDLIDCEIDLNPGMD